MTTNDEDKLILNGEMFFSIRKYIREKKSSNEIIEKIDEILKQGADINACDNNDNNNTILHIAAQKGEKEIVAYLLQKGAYLFYNKDENTAADLALKLNTDLGREIAQILSKKGKPAVRVTAKNSSKQRVETQQKYPQNSSISRSVSVQEISYPKRAGTSGVSGQFYETKLLSLVLYRALHDQEIKQFYLAANIKDIGDFDDVCFRYRDVVCFMQTKHRENTDKEKLTVASVRSTTGKLGLGIYFDSFLKIRQKFSPDATDPMFQGKFEDMDSYFVLYTPLKDGFERKLTENKKMCRKMHDIIYTGENEIENKNNNKDIFQFKYEDRDLDFLTGFIKREHMKVLGKRLLEFILSSNKLEVMMANDLVKIYHPALARDVLSINKVLEIPKATKTMKNTECQSTPAKASNSNSQSFIHMAKFRPEFFNSENYNLFILKDTLYKEIVYTHSPKTELSKDEVIQKIQQITDNPCAETISKLIGSPLKFDENNDKLILDNNKLSKNKYKHDEIQQIRYAIQKIQVTRTMVRDAVYVAGQSKLQALTFQLPQSFGNIDLTTNKKTKKEVEDRLDYLAGRFDLLIKHFSDRNNNKEIKIIDISDEVVGPGKILGLSQLNSNGGIGGAVGNLLEFDTETELFSFNTNGKLSDNAAYTLEKIKAITGEDLTSYKIKVIIDTFPRISFDTYQYDKSLAAEFLSKLWFYTKQAQEESVETTLKREINVHYNVDKQRHQFLFHVHSDAIFLRFHDEIQKWWKRRTEAHYLTKTTTIYEKAKRDIVDSPLLTVLNVMFIRKVKMLDIEFNENAIDCLNLNEFTEKHQNQMLNIVSDAVILSAAKIMQNNKYQNLFSFINLDYIHILPQNDCETMMEELKVIKDMTLVIISETQLNECLRNTLKNILSTQTVDGSQRRVIIITGRPLQEDQTQVFSNFKFTTIKDNNVSIADLSQQSQTSFLEKYTITYQGQVISLNAIVDCDTEELINAKLLWSILNKEKIEIGCTLNTQKYDEIKDYYINRTLKRDGESYALESLNDIDDKIVLISSKPGMGKTILLTHLSLETKKVDIKPWIVRINMSAYDKNIENLKNFNINTIITFLCQSALKDPNEVEKVNFIESEGKITPINNQGCENISFELKLFIQYYNSGHVIFLFDSFDKIFPSNTKEVLELFVLLKEANVRMWITSDCYVIKILERKFGSSYKLGQLTARQQKSFLQRFWATNLQLEKLNHEQLNNIANFINYFLKKFNREVHLNLGSSNRPKILLLSVPLHFLYLTIIDHFKNEAQSLSNHYFREKIKRKWRLNSYTPVDHYLGRSVDEDSLELAGTPLHMYIAANYFAFQITDKFDLHVNTEMISDRSNVYINALTLLKQFLERNIKQVCETEDRIGISDDQVKLRENFFENHKKMALYAICKESDISKVLTKSEIDEVKNTINLIQSGEMKSNLIDSVVDGVPRFYHWLFAEYFIVEVLSDLLKSLKNDNSCDLTYLQSFWDFVVNIVLVSSPQALRNAFEYKLKYDPDLAEVTNDDKCKRIIFNLLVKPNHGTDRNVSETDNALNIAINEGLENITIFLLRAVLPNEYHEDIDGIMSILKASSGIITAVCVSDSNSSEQLLNCIRNVDDKSILDILNSSKIGKNLQNTVKTKIVEPVKACTERLVQLSGNNENLVRLVEQLPFHLTDFVRQFKDKK